MFIHDQINGPANQAFKDAMTLAKFDAGLDWFWHTFPAFADRDFIFSWCAA